MIHLVSVVAFGDALITLSALEALAGSSLAPHRVFGSAVTQEVAKLLRSPPPMQTLLERECALFTVGKNGVRQALADFQNLRAQFSRLTAPGDTLAFEFDKRRARLLVPRGRQVSFPAETGHAYVDRMRWLAGLLDVGPVPWAQASTFSAPAGAPLLVNPCARHPSRFIPPDVLHVLVELAHAAGRPLHLLDPCAAYVDWEMRVDRYLLRPPMEVSNQELRQAGRYIGPDSFMLHLAYYHRIPAFGFFLRGHLPYLPPGTDPELSCMYFDQLGDVSFLREKVQVFLS